VVVPNRLLACPQDVRMAIAHELQHHRQRDTLWVYALWLLKTLCAPNPFIYLWERWISGLQEFACDETLVDRSKVESRQYARCLLEVAQSALDLGRAPACATGLAFRVEGNLLKKRIEKMLAGRKQGLARSFTFFIGAFLVVALGATVFASQGLVQDRRVSLADARAMAERAQRGSPFPVVVNDLVVRELNRYLGTPEGRDFMRKALSRMQSYRPLVEGKIAEYGMPAELEAIPIVESGYRNLGPRQEHPGWGAGIWMFIEQTARNYGLEVDAQADQRLDAGLETDAAMRYLKADELRFKDWLLAVMAYNMGESAVERAIDETGSRDAWVLTRQGYQNDENYLARVMAAVIILRNPQTLQ
jgi:hypothetical protein